MDVSISCKTLIKMSNVAVAWRKKVINVVLLKRETCRYLTVVELRYSSHFLNEFIFRLTVSVHSKNLA
jgi:hypothetical protein